MIMLTRLSNDAMTTDTLSREHILTLISCMDDRLSLMELPIEHYHHHARIRLVLSHLLVCSTSPTDTFLLQTESNLTGDVNNDFSVYARRDEFTSFSAFTELSEDELGAESTGQRTQESKYTCTCTGVLSSGIGCFDCFISADNSRIAHQSQAR